MKTDSESPAGHWPARLIREPLLHFLVIGAALFAGYAYLSDDDGGNTTQYEIYLTLDDLAQLELVFESKWLRPPTPEEFNNLVEDRIREEILYREALAMGLDEDDTIVRRRMAQKMKFLAEDVATAREPTSDELREWFESHGELFAMPPRASFRHIFFSADRRSGHARQDAEQALAGLGDEPLDSVRADALGDPFMFQDYYGERTPLEIARDFGPEFAQEVVKVPPATWDGPLQSGYGWHLVFVDSVIPGRIPAFEEVESDVKTAWLGEQKEAAWRKAYDDMRAKYKVLLPAPPAEQRVSSTGPATSSGSDTTPPNGKPNP